MIKLSELKCVGADMKRAKANFNRRLSICLLIFSLVLLPISSSVCLAQEGVGSSTAGVAAAGNAGSGGIAGLSAAGKAGIVLAAIAIVAIIVVASND